MAEPTEGSEEAPRIAAISSPLPSDSPHLSSALGVDACGAEGALPLNPARGPVPWTPFLAGTARHRLANGHHPGRTDRGAGRSRFRDDCPVLAL